MAGGKNWASAAIYVFCRNKAGKTCILAGKRQGSPMDRNRGLYNVPVGGAEPEDATPTDTAIRECREETGIDLSSYRGSIKVFGTQSWDDYRTGKKMVGVNCFVILYGTTDEYATTADSDMENDLFQWIPMEDVQALRWAYKMDSYIYELYGDYVSKADFGTIDKVRNIVKEELMRYKRVLK